MSGHFVTGISVPFSPVTVKATTAFITDPRDEFEGQRNRATWNTGKDYCHAYPKEVNS